MAHGHRWTLGAVATTSLCGWNRDSLATLALDLERDRVLHRRESRLGDVSAAVDAASLLAHAGHDKVDMVVACVAVNGGDPPEVTAGLCGQRSHGRSRQPLKIEPAAPLRGEDQTGNCSAPVDKPAVPRPEELRLRTGD